jgi:co-chaperonin GroES (HSP10)
MNRREFLYNSIGIGIIAGFGGSLKAHAQIAVDNQNYNLQTEAIFRKIIEKAKKEKWSALKIGGLIVKIGKEFLGTPYKGGTLDTDDYEICRLDLTGLDCVTFFENSLCMARIIKKGELSLPSLINEITMTRYRNGQLDDYTSRLHYTSDWIADNESKGIAKNVSRELGGSKFDIKVGFMSSNPDFYPQLRHQPDRISRMAEIEAGINSREIWYIPKENVKKAESKIESGDIIAITTNKSGLDYSHTGIAVKEGKKTLFMHASSKQKKVIIDNTISDYLSKSKSATGISVIRPSEPR